MMILENGCGKEQPRRSKFVYCGKTLLTRYKLKTFSEAALEPSNEMFTVCADDSYSPIKDAGDTSGEARCLKIVPGNFPTFGMVRT